MAEKRDGQTAFSRRRGFPVRFRQYAVKYAILGLCILLFVGYAFYTRYAIGRLHQDAIEVIQTYAELMRTAISENMSDGEMNVVFEEVIKKANNPIIVTDTTWRPILWKNIVRGPFYRRRIITLSDTTAQTRRFLDNKIVEFRRQFEPKPLVIDEGRDKIGYLVFGPSDLVTSLRWVPFLGLAVIVLFLVFAYLVFNTIRLTERSNLWAGLAKETAHQLGTPLSSLMGWVECLKTLGGEPFGEDAADRPVAPSVTNESRYLHQVHEICENMEHDLTRLRKITNRFSQVGSAPALTPGDINRVIQDTRAYLMLRLPVLRKRIEIRTVLGDVPPVEINRDLMEWVFENLMKNSINAIRRDDGQITIRTEYIAVEGVVRVSHSDNGSGVPRNLRRRIFAPGFTTKKRGWGLGLTLAKRIVEDYHRGRIYLSRSVPDKETVFCVDLPVSQRRVVGAEGTSHGGGTQDRLVG